MPAKIQRACLRAVATALLLFGTGAVSVQFDELQCEAAMAHLAECCPRFDPSRHNCERTNSCGISGLLPDLSEDESHCILALDCNNINARHLCATVDATPANTFDKCPNTAGCGGCPPDGAPPLYVIHAPVCQ